MAGIGLTGANNPIYQASAQMAQDSDQQRQAMMTQIVNQAMQKETQRVAAELQSYSVMSQSKDMNIAQAGLEGMMGLAGKRLRPDIAQHFDEVRTAMSELEKIMNNAQVTPDKKKAIFDSVTNRFAEAIPAEKKKNYQNKIESGFLQQATNFKQGMQGTPEEQAQYFSMLGNAGDTGQEILKAYNKPDTTDEKTDHYTLVHKATGQMKSMRLKSGDSIPTGWSIYKEPTQSDTPEGQASKKLDIEKKINGFVKDAIVNKFGKEAVQYDPFSESWAVTPNYQGDRSAIEKFAREEKVKQYERFNIKYPTEPIDEQTVRQLLQETGGNIEKAKSLGKRRGYHF